MSGTRNAGVSRARGVCNAANDWSSDGSASRPVAVFTVLHQVAGQLQQGSSSFAQQEAVLAIARDIAQAAVIANRRPAVRVRPRRTRSPARIMLC